VDVSALQFVQSAKKQIKL